MIHASVSNELRRIGRVALGDDVHRAARRFGARTAVIDGPARLTYEQLDARSSRFAHYLAARHGRGVQVGMLCANSADMVVALHGILKSGNVWVPVNVMLDGPQIRYILQHAEAAVVVVDEELRSKPHIAAALEELGKPVVVTRAAGEHSAFGPTLAGALQGQPDSLPEADIDGAQVALLMYTSGTTGNPKGVMHTHASVRAAALANVATFAITEHDVLSCVLPLFHCGQHCLLAAGTVAGSAVVVLRGFNPGEILDRIQGERLTVFAGLPMMYAGILADPRAGAADLASLRLCVYAMAPMPRPLVERIAARVRARILLATGQTEIYPVTMTFSPLEHPGRDANYWGISTGVCETAIMDDDGRLLGPGAPGEIVHRGPNVMLGYFKDPEATAAAQRFGWHHTGDLGVVDEGGQLLFLDRKKDMIKTGGENVASVKVEAAILAHPAVAGAAVVGLPHPHWSEAVTAFVVLKPGAACDEEQLLAHCRGLLGSFEVPKAVRVLEALPMTATGKMQKHVLRKAYEGLYASPGAA